MTKYAQTSPGEFGSTPRDLSVDVDTAPLFSDEEYNLAETDVEAIPTDAMSALRDDWITNRISGEPLYVVAEDGRMFYVSVGGDGKAITLHPVIPRYEIQEGGVTEYAGPDAFFTLEEQLGHYNVIPMQNMQNSNLEAHVATVRNPVWLKAVQRMMEIHKTGIVYNPYRK